MLTVEGLSCCGVNRFPPPFSESSIATCSRPLIRSSCLGSSITATAAKSPGKRCSQVPCPRSLRRELEGEFAFYHCTLISTQVPASPPCVSNLECYKISKSWMGGMQVLAVLYLLTTKSGASDPAHPALASGVQAASVEQFPEYGQPHNTCQSLLEGAWVPPFL